jgi:hypothetical protein
MVVATVPVESKLIFAIAVIYVLMAVIGMFALLRKD